MYKLKQEQHNAKDWPQVYRAKFLTAGLVSYEDSGAGIALLKNETINAALQSFIGKPVLIDHASVTPDNYEEHRKGNVIGTEFNPTDAWYYVDFIVDDDGANELVKQGYSVSCAYNVLDVGPGGLYQDISYDGEITKISFTHLALVTEPRYEESRILDELPAMLANGKVKVKSITNEEGMKMLSIFKKNKDGKAEEVMPYVVLNGKEIPLAEFLEAFNDKKEMKEEKYQAKDTDVVDVNGHSFTIGELKNMAMKNAKDEQEKDVEKEKDKDEKPEGLAEDKKDKKNEKEDKEKEMENEKDDKEEKKNSKDEESEKFFVELHNAANRGDISKEDDFAGTQPLTRQERASRWVAKTKKD